MAMLDDLGVYLAAQVAGWSVWNGTTGNIFLGGLPPEPDDVIVIAEYPGAPVIDTFREPKPPMIRPRVQIVSRATTYVDARDNCQKAWDALVAVMSQDINGSHYERIEDAGSSGPFPLDLDAADRNTFAANLQVWREPL